MENMLVTPDTLPEQIPHLSPIKELRQNFTGKISMRGEIIWVWPETWREIWSRLAHHQNAPKDLFCELYRELVKAFLSRPDVTTLADKVDAPYQARKAFRRTKNAEIQGEVALLKFFEDAYKIIDDLGGDPLSNYYFFLTEKFLDKYSLRYDLRRPFSLNPTLSGVFTRLIRELREATYQDTELRPLMVEFEDVIRDLKTDQSPGKIKTCIQKQINLLEAIGQRHPNAKSDVLSSICNEVKTWPHNGIRNALNQIYGFASSYPGIRHAGKKKNCLRDIEMRDLVAVSILLMGFSPYLTDLINPKTIYRGL